MCVSWGSRPANVTPVFLSWSVWCISHTSKVLFLSRSPSLLYGWFKGCHVRPATLFSSGATAMIRACTGSFIYPDDSALQDSRQYDSGAEASSSAADILWISLFTIDFLLCNMFVNKEILIKLFIFLHVVSYVAHWETKRRPGWVYSKGHYTKRSKL